jgi:hypothetical protein
MENYDAVLAEFLIVHQKKIGDYYAEHFKNLTPENLEIRSGSRYDRIVRVGNGAGNGSAWAFIDRTNGDILKPASYKAPAKHARGNLFNRESWEKITAYGPPYLK